MTPIERPTRDPGQTTLKVQVHHLAFVALVSPIIWLGVGLLPAWTATQNVNRYEDQGPPVGLALGIGATVVVEAIAVFTLALAIFANRRRWIAAVAALGHAALVACSLIARSVVVPNRASDTVLVVALILVTVLCALAEGTVAIGIAIGSDRPIAQIGGPQPRNWGA